MNTVPDLNTATPMSANGQTSAAKTPRLKLTSRGYEINHPDLEQGERLMSDALGAPDRDAMYGLLRQLIKAQRARAEA